MTDETSDTFTLAADFPSADRATWRALAEAALKGADFDKVLTTPLAEGIRTQPIYAAEDAPAAAGAVTRNVGAADRVRFGWDVRQVHAHPDPAETNKAILTDLERGANSVSLVLDSSIRRNQPPAADRVDGLLAFSVDRLDTALADVHLDAATVALQPGALYVAAAASMAALWRRRGIAEAEARGHLGADPLGALAADGRLAEPVDAALTRMGRLAARVHQTYPQVTTVSVDTSAYHLGGADEAMDLGYALATGVAYLRAMEAAGLEPEESASQMLFTLPVGVDVFLSIAKLRAARRLWGRVLEASGVPAGRREMVIQAVTADRAFAGRDAWVNMLRGTMACFAAGVGGADIVTVLPYTQAVGLPDGFARRIARNTQIILLEESNLARVIDPAGGSWYVETLTDELAAKAWAQFQSIEAEGGMAAALTGGSVAKACAGAWDARERQIAKARIQLTGVNAFPKPDEKPVDVLEPDTAALVDRLAPGAASPASAGDFVGLVEAAANGAGLLDLAPTGEPVEIAPITAHRLAEPFETLRAASDRAAERPSALLVAIGRAADYTARATFTRNYLGAGGIVSVDLEIAGAEGLEAALATALRDADAQGSRDLAVICSSDSLYDEHAAEVATALKQAGVTKVLLAGRPGDNEAAWRAAGVDGFIFAGDDMAATLTDLLAEKGVL